MLDQANPAFEAGVGLGLSLGLGIGVISIGYYVIDTFKNAIIKHNKLNKCIVIKYTVVGEI